MAIRKVPSQAASGRETFNDNLVGVQITDGSSQLTNTNFSIDKAIPTRDSKKFKTQPFSDFLTLDNISEINENDVVTTQTSEDRKNDIKFNGSKGDGGKSLYGSLKSRVSVSIERIIKKYPACLLVDSSSIGTIGTNTATDIVYIKNNDTTTFKVDVSKLYNPYNITLEKLNNNTTPEFDNKYRDFYGSYKKYVIEINGEVYNITGYVTSNSSKKITLTVKGNPFNNDLTYSLNFLIRPNNSIVEEFFKGLDDLETTLLNRESTPKYTSTFNVPKDNFSKTKTELTSFNVTWPTSKDNWNLQIKGVGYSDFITELSDLAEEIDNYKSNLIVRFLTSPSLQEYDTEDQKSEVIFQLYGQNFDKIKKFIDNIAYMRNVSYDGINNLPDILLKNLSETLGLDTVNLFDEKTLEETLYTRSVSQFSGVSNGKNLIDSENEFYRRILVNLAHIFKSKGTRSSIEFFLRFLGAPEPLIKINEHIYYVKSEPNRNLVDIESDIYSLILNEKKSLITTFNPDTYSYETEIVSGVTTYIESEYPINLVNGDPQKIESATNDMFFQKGAGWYDITLNHRSSTILDSEKSDLTGRIKKIITKSKPYTYGEDYFDLFRKFPGLDYGFELENKIDNIKAGVVDSESRKILNRKNIHVFLSSAQAIENDVYRQSRELDIIFGKNITTLQTTLTFPEYIQSMLGEQIKNSHIIKYKKNYIQLEYFYQNYLLTVPNPYDYLTVNSFINKMSPYWVQLLEQIIPATTLWLGGNIIENNIFGRSKYQYIKPCGLTEFVENLYPDFTLAINEDVETYIGRPENLRGLKKLNSVEYTLKIKINDVVYDNPYKVRLNKTTNTTTTAKLFDEFPINSECTNIIQGVNNLPLICDYVTYLNPDVVKTKSLWKDALIYLIDEIINKSVEINGYGNEDYQPFIDVVGSLEKEYEKILSYEFYFDDMGVEKVKFTINECLIKSKVDFYFTSEYFYLSEDCQPEVEFYTDGSMYLGSPNCKIISDVYFDIKGVKFGTEDESWLSNFFINCNGNPLTQEKIIEHVSGCTFVILGVLEDDILDIDFIDAGNCEQKIRIEGLSPNYIQDDALSPLGYTKVGTVDVYSGDPTGSTLISSSTLSTYCDGGIIDTGTTTLSHTKVVSISSYTDEGKTDIIDNDTQSTYCNNFISYSVYPNIQYRPTFDFGVKFGSKLYKIINNNIDNTTTPTDINTFITNGDIVEITPENVIIGDKLLSYSIINGPYGTSFYQNIPVSGVSFIYNYKTITVTNIDCFTSLKTSIINESYSVLPNTKIMVYSNRDVDGVLINYQFFEKYPEELYVKPPVIDGSCCGNEVIQNGDYMINERGELIEVTSISLDYCERNVFYHFNIDDVGVVNLFNNEMISYEQENFENLDINLIEFYNGGNCPTVPTQPSVEMSSFLIGLIRPKFGTVCDNVVLLPTPTPTATVVPPTPTPVPPTATPVPTATSVPPTATVVPPTPTETPVTPTPVPPTPVPPTPTPTPQGTQISLRYSASSGLGACVSGISSYFIPVGTFFNSTTGIFVNNTLSVKASTGYYSDGSYYRYWNQTTLFPPTICVAPTPTPTPFEVIVTKAGDATISNPLSYFTYSICDGQSGPFTYTFKRIVGTPVASGMQLYTNDGALAIPGNMGTYNTNLNTVGVKWALINGVVWLVNEINGKLQQEFTNC